MFNDIAPFYLSSLVALPVQNISLYSLRNSNDIRSIRSRTSLYYNSFLHAVTRDWNDLPCSDKIVITAHAFKRQLNPGRVIVPKYIYTGNRSMQTLHSRLRTCCSSLIYDIYLKNTIESPLCNCRCGDIENANHFFFRCNSYLTGINRHSITTWQYHSKYNPKWKINVNLFNKSKIVSFEAVQRYILGTKRFEAKYKVNRFHPYQSF